MKVLASFKKPSEASRNSITYKNSKLTNKHGRNPSRALKKGLFFNSKYVLPFDIMVMSNGGLNWLHLSLGAVQLFVELNVFPFEFNNFSFFFRNKLLEIFLATFPAKWHIWEATQKLNIFPIAVETFGSLGPNGLKFIK